VVPHLDKYTLCLILVLLGLEVLDVDLHAVLGKDDVLLLHLLLASLGEFVREFVHLVAKVRQSTYKGEEHHQGDQIPECAHD